MTPELLKKIWVFLVCFLIILNFYLINEKVDRFHAEASELRKLGPIIAVVKNPDDPEEIENVAMKIIQAYARAEKNFQKN